ncbi:MAG: hypothetical protein SGPRY_009970 [Prymnesium sp.]
MFSRGFAHGSQEAGKEPDAVGISLLAQPPPMRDIRGDVDAAIAELDKTASEMQGRLDSILNLLYTVERIERLSGKVGEWLTTARGALEGTEGLSEELEAYRAVRTCEKVAAEAEVMGGVMKELRVLEAAVSDHPELGERARALMAPISELDASEGTMASRAVSAKKRCEAERVRLEAEAAEARALGGRLFEFSVSVQSADEMASYPLLSDTTAARKALLETMETQATRLQAGRPAGGAAEPMGVHLERLFEKYHQVKEKTGYWLTGAPPPPRGSRSRSAEAAAAVEPTRQEASVPEEENAVSAPAPPPPEVPPPPPAKVESMREEPPAEEPPAEEPPVEKPPAEKPPAEAGAAEPKKEDCAIS